MQRLGHGPYESVIEDKAPPSVEHARNIFLDEVRRLVPRVLEDLANEPFELFQQTSLYFEADKNRIERVEEGQLAVERYLWTHYNRPYWGLIESPTKNTRVDAKLGDRDGFIAAFRDRLFKWSLDHNLNAEWCRKRAYETLDFWIYSHQEPDDRRWHIDSAWQSIVPEDNPPKFIFEFKPRNYPLSGFRSDLEERTIKDFKKKLKAFFSQLEERAKQGGLVLTPRKRNLTHFAWLVEHQVNGLGYDEIAEKYQDEDGLEISSISEGITKTAKLIRLPLRPEQGRSKHS